MERDADGQSQSVRAICCGRFCDDSELRNMHRLWFSLRS
jgi:hypothetical protein